MFFVSVTRRQILYAVRRAEAEIFERLLAEIEVEKN